MMMVEQYVVADKSMQEMSEKILADFFIAGNAGDLSRIAVLYAPDAIIHTASGIKHGPDAIVKIFEKWRHAFPDCHIEPLTFHQEDDVIVVHWRAVGTFLNAFGNAPPTGKKTTIHGFSNYRCAHGQVVEHWARIDYRFLEP